MRLFDALIHCRQDGLEIIALGSAHPDTAVSRNTMSVSSIVAGVAEIGPAQPRCTRRGSRPVRSMCACVIRAASRRWMRRCAGGRFLASCLRRS